MIYTDRNGLSLLFDELKRRGFSVVGPTVSDRAVVYRELNSFSELPEDRRDDQHPGHYTLQVTEGAGLFSYAAGPVSLKPFFYPPRRETSEGIRVGRGMELKTNIPANGGRAKPLAFFGVKSCELAALAVHDRIFLNGPYADPYYKAVREQAFIIAAHCLYPSSSCFCTSMNTGPRARTGFDLAMTEVSAPDGHRYFFEIGSGRGEEMLRNVPHEEAGEQEIEEAEHLLKAAAEKISRKMKTENLNALLQDNFDHPEWDKVAGRCLACANCTMVCPTCFCSSMEDVTDLDNGKASRWRVWDSCFTMDFAKVASGNFRPSVKARYRQWLMHKLGYWNDQFGTSGCVGCGRCITWCPVGIDITQEVETIRTTSIKKEPEHAY